MSALREVQLIARGIGVWVVWVLLTGDVTHDNSYGDLRRLSLREFAAHLAPMVLVVGVGVHLVVNVPSGFGAVWLAGSVVWFGAALALVATTLVLSWLIDIHLTYV
jgi:uncharacterized membrane protein (DUF485 family)